MPNVSSHLGVAVKVKEKLNIEDDIFYYGALLPDIINIDKIESHFKVKGKFFLIPNLEYYRENYDLSNPLYLGYYLHLYLDYYYLEEYLDKYCHGIDVFNDRVYDDYDILNKDLVKHFDIDIDKMEEVLNRYADKDVNKKKLNNNINCLKLSKDGNLRLLDKNSFIKFLDKTVNNFIKEQKK